MKRTILLLIILAFAAGTQAQTITISQPVTVNGQAQNIGVTVRYDLAPAYTVSLTNDGNGTASAIIGGANVTEARQGETVTITATPASADYQFKEWVVVSGGAALSSMTTIPATFTMPGSAVEIKAEFELTGKALANIEAAKITGFAAGTNTSTTLVFTPAVSSALNGSTTVNFVSVKTGTNSGDATTTDWGASSLSLNTRNVVNNGSYAYVDVTFTATLDGVTSDPVTLELSSLFNATSTAGKLRTDKENLTATALEIINITTGLKNVTKRVTGNPLVMSAGVSVPEATGSYGTVSAISGGNLTMNVTSLPTNNLSADFIVIQLQCEGTSYSMEITIYIQK